jgi:phosphate transport system permease protein
MIADFQQTRRMITDRFVRGACFAFTLLALVPLGSVLLYVVKRGGHALDWSFFTHLPAPVGEAGGGIGNAIVGTLTLVLLACSFGIPIGVAAGVYLSEFGERRFAPFVRFCLDVMSGIPSITIGLFVYALLVVPQKHFSALAGGFALGILMLPTVTRTTEELLRLVPDVLREGALALGVPRWRAIVSIVVPTAGGGIVTGVMLAVARVAGETAPLLFTAFGNQYWATSLNEPTSALPMQIFTYAVSPYDEWHAQAWAAALLLVAGVFLLNVAARVLVRRRA